jgi:hypothetical protein
MSVKTALILILVLGLIVVEGYLISTSILEKMNQDKDVQSFCGQKCSFSESTSYWEFSGENGTKGFTTQNECLSYCSDVRRGFISILQGYGSDFRGAISNIFQK